MPDSMARPQPRPDQRHHRLRPRRPEAPPRPDPRPKGRPGPRPKGRPDPRPKAVPIRGRKAVPIRGRKPGQIRDLTVAQLGEALDRGHGHHRRLAQIVEHGGRRLHLGLAPSGMGLRPGHQPGEPLLIGGLDLAGQVAPEPDQIIGRRSGPERLDQHRSGAFHHDASQQLPGRRRSRGPVQRFGPTAEGVDHRAVALGAVAGDQGGRRQAGARHHGHERSVCEVQVPLCSIGRQLALQLG